MKGLLQGLGPKSQGLSARLLDPLMCGTVHWAPAAPGPRANGGKGCALNRGDEC